MIAGAFVKQTNNKQTELLIKLISINNRVKITYLLTYFTPVEV